MPERPFHRRFGTARLFAAIGPGRYVPLTPLGIPLTRDGSPVSIERRRADRTYSRPAGWYVIGPPDWNPTWAGGLAREAAQRLHTAIRDHDRTQSGLARP